MRHTATLLLAIGAVFGSAACREDPAIGITQRIIDELVAQDYGAATSRFRMAEDQVLSLAAAPVWRRALEHQSTTVREWAVDALGRIGQQEDVRRLAERLADSSRGVRRGAMMSLIQIDPGAARAAFDTLLRASKPESIVLGAQGLAELKAFEGASLVLERMSDTTLPSSTRRALAQVLATLGNPVAVGPLLALALDPEVDLSLRRMAAEALVALEGEAVREAAQRLVQSEDAYISDLARRLLANDVR